MGETREREAVGETRRGAVQGALPKTALWPCAELQTCKSESLRTRVRARARVKPDQANRHRGVTRASNVPDNWTGGHPAQPESDEPAAYGGTAQRAGCATLCRALIICYTQGALSCDMSYNIYKPPRTSVGYCQPRGSCEMCLCIGYEVCVWIHVAVGTRVNPRHDFNGIE